MTDRRVTFLTASLVALAAFVFLPRQAHPDTDSAAPEPSERVFEMRTYTTLPGRMPAMLARFRDHTTTLFEKHGMTNIGYWVPTDGERSEDTLIYIIAHESREAAAESWRNFIADPAWHEAREASEADGRIVSKVEAVYMSPTDFSAIQ